MTVRLTNDERTAARRTKREAERYPLLARIGITRTWTAEDVAQERAEMLADALRRETQGEGQALAVAQLFRAACSEVVDAATLMEMDLYVSRAYPPGAHYAADFWHLAAGRLGPGGPALAPAQVWAEPKARQPVPPEVPFKLLRRAPAGASVGQLLDAGAPEATVQDMINALCQLRKQGLAEAREGGGWRLTAAGREASL